MPWPQQHRRSLLHCWGHGKPNLPSRSNLHCPCVPHVGHRAMHACKPSYRSGQVTQRSTHAAYSTSVQCYVVHTAAGNNTTIAPAQHSPSYLPTCCRYSCLCVPGVAIAIAIGGGVGGIGMTTCAAGGADGASSRAPSPSPSSAAACVRACARAPIPYHR